MPIQRPLTFEFSNFDYIHLDSQYGSISKLDFHRFLDNLFDFNYLYIMHFTGCWMFHLSFYHNQPFLHLF